MSIAEHLNCIAMTRSEERIEKAFFELLDGKSYAEISVIDICDRAGVARKTFYRHYDGKAGVVERKMNREFAAFAQTTTLRLTRALYAYWYAYLLADRAFAKCLTDADAREIVVTRIISLVEIALENDNHNAVSLEPTTLKYYLRFFAVGLISIMQSWVEDDCKVKPEAMAALTERLLFSVTQLVAE